MNQINQMTLKLTGNQVIVDALGFQQNRYKSLISQKYKNQQKGQPTQKQNIKVAQSLKTSPEKLFKSFDVQREQLSSKRYSIKNSRFRVEDTQKYDENFINDILKPMKPVKLNRTIIDSSQFKKNQSPIRNSQQNFSNQNMNQRPTIASKKSQKLNRSFIQNLNEFNQKNDQSQQQTFNDRINSNSGLIKQNGNYQNAYTNHEQDNAVHPGLLNVQSSLSRENELKSYNLNSDLETPETFQLNNQSIDNQEDVQKQNSQKIRKDYKRSNTSHKPKNAYEMSTRQRKFIIVDIEDYQKMTVIRDEKPKKVQRPISKTHLNNLNKSISANLSIRSMQKSVNKDGDIVFIEEPVIGDVNHRFLAKKKIKKVKKNDTNSRSKSKSNKRDKEFEQPLSYKNRAKTIKNPKIDQQFTLNKRSEILRENFSHSMTQTLKQSHNFEVKRHMTTKFNDQSPFKLNSSMKTENLQTHLSRVKSNHKSRKQSRANSITPEIRVDHNIIQGDSQVIIDYNPSENQHNIIDIEKDIEVKVRSKFQNNVRPKVRELYSKYWSGKNSNKNQESHETEKGKPKFIKK
eukprot:403372923